MTRAIDQDVSAAVARAHHEEWARVLAATVRVTRDLDLAEECAQDAYTQALQTWSDTRVPDRPGAWLTTVARNRAKDVLRRESVLQRKLPLLVTDDVSLGPDENGPERDGLDDDLLRLIFTCCHPALARETQVALTLRLLCGLTTAEVAHAFLVQESTMSARITRAKRKIAAARIPYRVPSKEDLPTRVTAVLDVVHLVFTTGHAAPIGRNLVRVDLVESAIELARTLRDLLPDNAEVAGLLALVLLTDARRKSRTSGSGALVLLPDQDRSQWDRSEIGEGVSILRTSMPGSPPSRYAIQAAIAAVHAEAPTWEQTDWAEIVALYDALVRLWPTPVVRLNRAVAIGLRDGPDAGLAALSSLLDEPALATYAYLSSARADFLRRLRRWDEAATAYEEALTLTDNDVEREFLASRLDAVRTHES